GPHIGANTRRLGHVGKSAAADVVEQTVAAGDRRDIEVRIPVIVIVEQHQAGGDTRVRLGQPGTSGRVGERPVAVVVVHGQMRGTGEHDVLAAVAVDVAHRTAGA